MPVFSSQKAKGVGRYYTATPIVAGSAEGALPKKVDDPFSEDGPVQAHPHQKDLFPEVV